MIVPFGKTVRGGKRMSMSHEMSCRGGFDGCEFGAFIAIVILLFVIFAGLGFGR